MDTVTELLYRATRTENAAATHGEDSAYARQYAVRRELMRTLLEGMTKEQQDWFDEYNIADERAREILNMERFRQAFYLGAQMMEEFLQNGAEPPRGSLK